MDISTATTLASGLVALIVPAFVYGFFGMVVIVPTVLEVAKLFGSKISSGSTILSASILLGTIAIAATGGFDGTYTWGIVLAGVVGVAQTVYTLVNQAFDGKLSKDSGAI